MRLLRVTNLSLRMQLIGMAFIILFVALSSAGIALYFLERDQARQELTQELSSLAQLLGNRSSAAIVFLDDATANENLTALKGLTQINAACLYDIDDQLFASYINADPSPGNNSDPCAKVARFNQPTLVGHDDVVQVEVAVFARDTRVGHLRITSSENPLAARMFSRTISFAIAFSIALLVSILIAFRLQAAIIEPIAKVRDVATAVIDSGDYALRAPELGKHEVGRLANAFNAMLATISIQNQSLAESEAYSRRLFHDSPIAQLVFDAEHGICLDCNQAAVMEVGLTRHEELIDKAMNDISAKIQLNGIDTATAFKDFYAQIKNKNVLATEWRFQRNDGVIWDGWMHVLVFYLGERQMLHISVQNITKRKQAEEALFKLNLDLENRVEARTNELAGTNLALRKALSSLQQTQSELLQKEKLASLGALVAGIAHELNTPLGTSVLVATTFQDVLHSLMHDVEAKTLSKSRTIAMLERLDSGSSVLLRNLGRAAELIVTFKQVAVDQTSEHRRTFDLAQTIKHIIETLQPQFKKTAHSVQIDIPSDIKMDSFPGPLGQVITNLVLNALAHAFETVNTGVIRVSATCIEHGFVRLTVTDNGSGIPAENLPRLFDPFFTTKLGQGGSGLGLHIAYNIVTATLGGKISAMSSLGEGAIFVLDLPLIAPTADTRDFIE